ncbi:hypothetical protein AUC43_03870 [Hymenobacter sedentarius]|uniref:Uncharacterized protein n=1 Tax=Hymenobacter sedentarius TaxID=1411621 RepID=A0A0U4ALE2_9BACT|nr:hypothetical protein AUC43_03870 [Hymenobacter sedentarius]
MDSVPGVSNSVAESKRRNVFIQELTLQRNFTNPTVQVESAWLEKRWTYTGYSHANTAIISHHDNYVSLIVILSRNLGDSTLINTSTNKIADAHTQKVVWFITPRPSTETLTFKMVHQDLVLPNNSCTFLLPSAEE